MLLPVRHRATGRADDFERTRDAGGVGLLEAGCGFRIEAFEFEVIVGDGRGADLGADGRVDRRYGSDALEQGSQIEAGTADQDRKSAFGVESGDFRLGQFRPVGCRAGSDAIADPVKAVVGARAVGGRGCSREDRDIGVKLGAVRVDYRAPGGLGEREAERRLAAGGRTGNEGDWRICPLDHCHADSSRAAR